MTPADQNPFAFWQNFWQNANPQLTPFLPPMSLEEVNKKITELKSVEVWLNFNLQAVQTQLVGLEQQKLFFNSFSELAENIANASERAVAEAEAKAESNPEQPSE